MIVHLIDGTYELFRHFYGLRRFTQGEDRPLGAVVGVLNTVLQMIEQGATEEEKKWQKIGLVRRHLVSDHLLEGKRPALVLEGEDAYLEYSSEAGGYRKAMLEVLKHPWSSVLVICDEADRPFHRKDLYSGYAVTEIIEVPLPENVRNFRVRVTKHPKSLGNQAWILGAGADL